MSQSQLSRTIQSLEKELGVVLFERDRQGVSVTPDGAAVLSDAQVLLKAEETFNAKVAAMRNKSAEELRIGVGAFVSQSWVTAAIADLARKHPAISISMRELDWWKLADVVLGEEFHLVIGECSEAELNPDIIVERFPERLGGFFVRSGHALDGCRMVSLDQIAEFPLAAPRLPSRVSQFLPARSKLGHVSEDGRYFLPMIESATPRSMIDVVLASNAVCITLRQLCAEPLGAGAMVELPCHPPWLRIRQGIMYARGRPLSETVLAFRAVAKVAERKYFADRGQRSSRHDHIQGKGSSGLV